MKNKRTITICSSVVFYRQVLEVAKELKGLNIHVKVPKTAYVMRRTNNFDVDYYKTWYKNQADYTKKTSLMKDHFKKVIESNGILVLNLTKNGVEGYIGGNVLMEMVIAFHYKKPIYIYTDISPDSPFLEEIYGMNPIFIQQNVKKIVQ